MVTAACRLIEQAETVPTLEQLAQPSGLSPFHFHRVFKAVAGVTPKQYATAHRNRGVRSGLERSHTVTEAIFDAGYNASSRFYETANEVLGMTPSRYRAGGADSEIRVAIGACLVAAVLAAQTAAGGCPVPVGV